MAPKEVGPSGASTMGEKCGPCPLKRSTDGKIILVHINSWCHRLLE